MIDTIYDSLNKSKLENTKSILRAITNLMQKIPYDLFESKEDYSKVVDVVINLIKKERDFVIYSVSQD